MRRGWDAQIGYLGLALKESGVWRLLGFANFPHYCEERLGLAARTVEQRVALERQLWKLPSLRKAAQEGALSYEKVRLIARRPEEEIDSWIERARSLTCIKLRRAMEADEEAQLRARQALRVRLPLRVALILAAAFRAVRGVEGKQLTDGQCLARVAEHFLEIWKQPKKTRAHKVLERDRCFCQVPGCSRAATHVHHRCSGPRAAGTRGTT